MQNSMTERSERTIATVEYLKRLPLYEHEKPFRVYYEIPKSSVDKRRSNLEFEKRDVVMSDLRDCETPGAFTLDKHGFAIRKFWSNLPVNDFTDRAEVERVFFPEVEKVIRSEISNITAFYFFDWRLRSSGPYAGPEMIDLNDPTCHVRPAQQVHVDQSDAGVLHRVQMQLGEEEAARLLQGRLRIINLWKPLRGPVQDYPLALCDGSTVPREDLVECDQIRKRYFGATNYVYYRPSHNWYYLSNMQPDEAFLIKIFDSNRRVDAQFCPHSSFEAENCPEDAPHRLSIEIRALIFTSD